MYPSFDSWYSADDSWYSADDPSVDSSGYVCVWGGEGGVCVCRVCVCLCVCVWVCVGVCIGDNSNNNNKNSIFNIDNICNIDIFF